MADGKLISNSWGSGCFSKVISLAILCSCLMIKSKYIFLSIFCAWFLWGGGTVAGNIKAMGFEFGKPAMAFFEDIN